MSISNDIIKNKKFKQFTYSDRLKLEVLLKIKKMKKDEIAEILNKTVRSINREIKKGLVELLNSNLSTKIEYSSQKAEKVSRRLASNKGKSIKLGNDQKLAKHIEDKIKNHKWSPAAVIGEIEEKGLEFNTRICTKTLYNYIDRNIILGISNKDLPVKKNKKKRTYKKVRLAYNNIKGTSIEERPKEIDTRLEYGHWEMDCVIGKKNGSGNVLLVLTERSTRQEIIRKIPNKKQESVIKELNSLEKEYKKRFKIVFKTITVDNGIEFLNYKSMEESVLLKGVKRTKIYYAHPFSSYERGSNENANKLIRRFIPKGTDLKDITKKEVKRIEHWMNNYPRGIFGYRTSNDMVNIYKQY